MTTMFDWMRKELKTKNVEPNSQLGSIFEYFIARETALLAFTEYEGAPLDNNAVEQLIKLVALLRKNAMFFLSLNGANDADRILSVGATAGMAGVNLYDYFVALQRFSLEVEKCPENFLPWNYQKTISNLETELAKGEHRAVRELTAAQWKERQERLRNQRLELRKRRSARNISHKKIHTG
jgi:Transposase IS66 family